MGTRTCTFARDSAREKEAHRLRSTAAAVFLVMALLLVLPVASSAAIPGWTERALGTRAVGSDFITATHGWVVGSTYASDPGTNPGTNPGTDPGIDPGIDPDTDPDMGALAYTYSLRETTNGGATWTSRTLPAGVVPVSIAFGDATHGWLVGVTYDASYNETGYIYGTNDGGATWKLQATGITDRYTDIDAADATHAYVFKQDVISGTSDGSTWTKRSEGLASRYESLHVSSVGHVWLGGVSFSGSIGSVIVVSKDGGTTWTKQPNPGKGKLWAIYGVDANNAWAAGYESFTLLRTVNGGAAWTAVSFPGGRDVFSVAFTSPTHGWVCTGGAADGKTLFETSDGGATWTGYAAGNANSMMSLWAPDATHVLAIGGSPNSSLWTRSGVRRRRRHRPRQGHPQADYSCLGKAQQGLLGDGHHHSQAHPGHYRGEDRLHIEGGF